MRTCPRCENRFPDSEQFCSRDGATLSAPDGLGEDPRLGVKIEGGYVIEERLGEGGMGIVYRATHPKTKQTVALKVLRSEYTQNQDILNRFYQEARAVGQLQHPHIAQVLDLGALPDGNPYLLLEYLRGVDLATFLKEDGPLEIERALPICIQAADALRAAHHAGIIHRDLKPENIFLVQPTANSAQSTVKLLDFGLAKLVKRPTDDISREEARTRSGVIMGTPFYMSPEQASGKPVDPQSDVYALGVIFYEMLTGRVPFRSPDGPLHVLMQHLNEPPPPPTELQPSISPEVESLILACLEKNKDLRYPSAEVLYNDLVRVQNQERPLFQLPKAPPAKKTKQIVGVASFGLLLIAAGSLYAIAPWKKSPPPILSQPTTPVITASAPVSPTSEPQTILISVETTPPGAEIWLDGVLQEQKTPTSLPLSRHDALAMLVLKKDGFEESSQSISLRSDLSLRLSLTPVPAVPVKNNPKKNPNKTNQTQPSDPTDTTPPDQLDPYEKKKKEKRKP